MTTNKPEVLGFFSEHKQADGGFRLSTDYFETRPDAVRFAFIDVRAVPVIRLSEYEALQAEFERLRKDAERYRSLLEAVLREIPHRQGRRGNAPGHGHSVSGVWDEDNGALAGKECAWCKVWREALSAMQGDQS